MKFYIQKNISEKDVNELVEILNKNKLSYELFYHIPFDDSYPQIDKEQHAFVYGASSVTDKVYKDLGVAGGVFAHTNEISLKPFFEETPTLMWNTPIFMGQFKDFKINNEAIFIRPLIDSKWLAGTVMEVDEFNEWLEKLKKIDFDFSEQIFVSELNQPESEYRLFFVNGNFSTGSQYKKNFELYKNRFVPDYIIQKAENFVFENKHNLPKSFVVDVGQKEDKIGIIEVNGINNAGFYDIDKEKLMLDLMK